MNMTHNTPGEKIERANNDTGKGCEKCQIPSYGFQKWHKMDCDCSCHTAPDTEGWRERLRFEVIEDYILHAQLFHYARNKAEAMDELRHDWERLVAFVEAEIARAHDEALEEGAAREREDCKDALRRLRKQALIAKEPVTVAQIDDWLTPKSPKI